MRRSLVPMDRAIGVCWIKTERLSAGRIAGSKFMGHDELPADAQIRICFRGVFYILGCVASVTN